MSEQYEYPRPSSVPPPYDPPGVNNQYPYNPPPQQPPPGQYPYNTYNNQPPPLQPQPVAAAPGAAPVAVVVQKEKFPTWGYFLIGLDILLLILLIVMLWFRVMVWHDLAPLFK
jgi:hypothetical protein